MPPLIAETPYQEELRLGLERYRRAILHWKRRARKTTTLSGLAIGHMSEKPWNDVIYSSMSLNAGGEMLITTAKVWRWAMERLAKFSEQNGLMLKSDMLNISIDDIANDLIAGKAEAKLYHSKTEFSRLMLRAASVQTIKSYGALVMLDEIQDILDLKNVIAESKWIASTEKSMKFLMAGTTPLDDGHYSVEITNPPDGMTFEPNPRGHWYESTAGYMVHRVDAWDYESAGLHFLDDTTGDEISADESRRRDYDKDGWDRANALKVIPDGTIAVPSIAIQHAMEKGRDTCAFADVKDVSDFPDGWRDNIGDGRLSIGIDPATTEKKKSNPTSLTLMEDVGGELAARLIVRWKTKDPAIARRLIAEVCNVGPRKRVSVIVIYGTNERYFAVDLQREWVGKIPVQILIESEKTNYLGEDMLFKAYLGKALVNDFMEYKIWLPASERVRADMRLVTTVKGSFDANVDSEGNHGDTFASTAAARHGIVTRLGGPVEARAVATSRIGSFLGRLGGGSARDRGNARVIV